MLLRISGNISNGQRVNGTTPIVVITSLSRTIVKETINALDAKHICVYIILVWCQI